MKALPWIAGTAACLFYLAVHSTFYNFDGVACAIAVELSDLPHLVHGNHLAYGLVSLAFFKLWQVLGYAGPAILSLQALDSLLGGSAAGVFCGLLLRLKIPPPRAAAATAGLVLSYAWWLWSLEPQVYMLGALFLALAARELFSDKPNPIVLGLFHAGAVLGHVGHMTWMPCVLYWLWTSQGAKRRSAIIRYGAAMAAALFAVYALTAYYVIEPSGQTWRLWLLGSAALTADRSFAWHGNYSLINLKSWALMTLRIFTNPYELAGAARWFGWLLAAAALAAAGLGARTNRRLAIACLIWIAGYAVLFISWEPYTVVYRITDLMPLWILIALAAGGVRGRWGDYALCGWIAVAGLFNWTQTISPHTDPRNNITYQQALWLSRSTPEGSWITAVSLDQVYIPYFAYRKPLNLRYYVDQPVTLARRLAVFAASQIPVYATSDALAIHPWGEFFKSYRLEEVGRLENFALFRVGPPVPESRNLPRNR